MPSVVQVQCPAKVNLFLEVTGKRRDGYHTLATLFAKISLFDVIDAESREADGAARGPFSSRAVPEAYIAKGGAPLSLEIVDEVGQGLSAGPDNLVLRAAEAFRREFKVGMAVKLRLTKRIPMGAGLGGGSSDAAGTLRALARLFKLEREKGLAARLRRLAAGLGADVPFFLRDEAFCEGRGVGERLRGLKPAKSLPWMILIYPGLAVSTKSVFGRLKLDSRPAVLTRLSHLDTLIKKLEKGRPIPEWEGLLFNRLEQEVLTVHPEVRQARTILDRLGLKGALMSGSGSSVFGFASSHAEGERALKRLQGYPWKTFLTCCLG